MHVSFGKCKIKWRQIQEQIKLTLNRHGQEFEAPKISTQSAHEGGKVVSPTHTDRLYPQEISVVLISVSD
jgi:hypothetical protein